MNHRDNLLKEMKESVGTKDPIDFFTKMVDMFSILFEHIDLLEKDLLRVKTQSALSIQWEPRVASDMLVRQVDILRKDKGKLITELEELKVIISQKIRY